MLQLNWGGRTCATNGSSSQNSKPKATTTSTLVWVTHYMKKSLQMRLPISDRPRNPQKIKRLNPIIIIFPLTRKNASLASPTPK
ncbi:hypothetical protein SBA4_2730021 [Candidatus Sulfopaludibacter sp. SbA4]|nr:hypothetical protein SBA4_2730021 [Candidatus Sulfopaludibacter sp. SbA4]